MFFYFYSHSSSPFDSILFHSNGGFVKPYSHSVDAALLVKLSSTIGAFGDVSHVGVGDGFLAHA